MVTGKNVMKQAFTGAIVVFAMTVFCVRAQVSAHPVLQEAERLALAGATEEAVTEYKRYLFFNPDSPAVSVYLSMAEAYRDRGRPGDAQDALRSALSSAGSDSVRDAIRIEYSVLDMAQGKFSPAQMELIRIVSFSKNAAVRNRATLFLCIADCMTGEWDEAKKISSGGAASGDGLSLRLDSLLRKVPRYTRKSPGAAKILSSVLPGLGQVYAHDFGGGLNALLISAVTGFMTVNSIFYGYYQEAIFTDIALFWRYYSGNRWLAFRAAEKYNAEKDRLFLNMVIDKILPRRYLK
jgi:tetratricopeptide (TPR) repeat protein